jgi:hypothetical protein
MAISRSPANRSVLYGGSEGPPSAAMKPVRSSGPVMSPKREITVAGDVSALEAKVAQKMLPRTPKRTYEAKPVRSERVRRFAEQERDDRARRMSKRGRRA